MIWTTRYKMFSCHHTPVSYRTVLICAYSLGAIHPILLFCTVIVIAIHALHLYYRRSHWLIHLSTLHVSYIIIVLYFSHYSFTFYVFDLAFGLAPTMYCHLPICRRLALRFLQVPTTRRRLRITYTWTWGTSLVSVFWTLGHSLISSQARSP